MSATVAVDPAAPTTAARPSRWVVVTATARFAAVGLAYGIALRAWMRFVAEDPAFSWSGTTFIVGAFTIGFAACGLVAGGRRRGWRGLLVPVRVVAVVLCLPCFTAAGAVMLPTVVPGALALARTDWARWLRRVLGAVAFLGTLILLAGGPGALGWGRSIVAWVLYCVLVLVEIRAFAEPYRPSVKRLPTAARVACLAIVALGALKVAALALGLLLA